MNTILEMTNISKVYREGNVEVLAIDDVSLSLHSGEVLLLMGPSGSGKTTLLSMMGCILHPTKGEIRLDNYLVSSMQEDSLPHIRKKYFGFVFQSFNLFPTLSALENIELALRLKINSGSKSKTQALELLKRVGLIEKANFYPADLSGGQKQRVAFARALVGDPPIILADEPTANLDSKKGKELLALLRDHAREYGKAVTIVSHDPKAESVADRIIVLEDGKVKE